MITKANNAEFKALYLHVSVDPSRSSLNSVWLYESEGGSTYVASDGHTLIVRRAGTHRNMSPFEVGKLHRVAMAEDQTTFASVTDPPAWWTFMTNIKTGGKVAPAYGLNPDYFARIGDVERAAGRRASEDYESPPGTSKKDTNKKRASLKTSAYSVLTVPSDPLDPWRWSITTDAAMWEGLIMPRRV